MELDQSVIKAKPYYILLSVNKPIKEFAIIRDSRLEKLNNLKLMNQEKGFDSTLIETHVGGKRSRKQKEMLFEYYLNKGYDVITNKQEKV